MRRMLFILGLYSIFAYFSSSIFANDKLLFDPRPHLIFPSYEAQTLGKIAEIPVDLYTGRTNISIPLFTISYNGIEIPISLSYHGGGIKVNEESGLVGTGWTLNAGGGVSRIVRGMPDELYNIEAGAYGYDNLNSGTNEFINEIMHRGRPNDPKDLLLDTSKSSRYMLKQMETYGQLFDGYRIDIAPDNYMFCVSGLSGAFVGKQPKYIQTQGGCTLEYYQSNDSYILKDLNGHKYTFRNHENKIFQYRPIDVMNPIIYEDVGVQTFKYVSAWWLSSILSPAGDSITFIYEEEQQLPQRESFYGYTEYRTMDAYASPISKTKKHDEYNDPYKRVGLDTIYRQLLSEIRTPYCRLKFSYKKSKYGYSQLSEITIHSVVENNDCDTIESFEFIYDNIYFQSKLIKLKHWGRNKDKYQLYSFTYHSISDTIDYINRDHWGYYSKESNGRFASKSYFGIQVTELKNSNYTERYADTENSSNNMLKSITYPSGLLVNFEWEPHDFSQLSAVGTEAHRKLGEYDYSNSQSEDCKVGGVRIKRIEHTDNGRQVLTKEYSYVDSAGNSTGVLAYPPRYASLYPKISYVEFSELTDLSSHELWCDLLVLRSNGLPYTLNGGGHIEYGKVTEITKLNNQYNSTQMNKIDYYYSTSVETENSDIDDTQYDTLIAADMLQLTSMRHRRGDLIKKVEYTDDHKETIYNYQIIEQNNVTQIPGYLFPIADYQESHTHVTDNNNHSLNPYKNFGIVKYRVIPYNKRVDTILVSSDKINSYDIYTYADTTYSSSVIANLPISHAYANSQGEEFIEHYQYEGNTNKIKKCTTTTKEGEFIKGYGFEYDEKCRLKAKIIARINSNNTPKIEHLVWDTVEVYEYDLITNQVVQIKNRESDIVTTYLWSYGGAYPVAEITNANLDEVQNALGISIDDITKSYEPNISEIDKLRGQLDAAQVKTMTYLPLIGMTSYTDMNGYTLYYEYDSFGRICEISEKVGQTKNVLKSFNYNLRNQY